MTKAAKTPKRVFLHAETVHALNRQKNVEGSLMTRVMRARGTKAYAAAVENREAEVAAAKARWHANRERIAAQREASKIKDAEMAAKREAEAKALAAASRPAPKKRRAPAKPKLAVVA